jgi:hypothetical protein
VCGVENGGNYDNGRRGRDPLVSLDGVLFQEEDGMVMSIILGVSSMIDIIISSMGKMTWKGSGDKSPREGVEGVAD